MNSPTCRNCKHAVWQMSKNGKNIRRQTPGECTAFGRVIWPVCKALKCPGFVRKGADHA